ncbi:hypothetical protein [Larkinella harenae]
MSEVFLQQRQIGFLPQLIQIQPFDKSDGANGGLFQKLFEVMVQFGRVCKPFPKFLIAEITGKLVGKIGCDGIDQSQADFSSHTNRWYVQCGL